MTVVIESLSAWRESTAHLSRLLNADPQRAVDEARQLRGKGGMRDSVLALRGGILIDGGGYVKDRKAVVEGVRIFRQLASKHSGDPTLRYNLANGLTEIGRLNDTRGADWYVATRSVRREARCIFQRVAEETSGGAERAKALINLGNELDAGFRWVEAYDRWARSLREDPSNRVGALSAARMLLRRMQYDLPHPASLHRVAGYYTRLAAGRRSDIERIAGSGAVALATNLPTFRSAWRPRKLHQIKDDFGRFVAQHRLALVGTVEGLDLRRKRWDEVHLPRISEKLSAGAGVPAIFAMFNQLKADFCAARWLAFSWDRHPPRDTSVYMDTLDYAVYGVGPSLLALAQRSAVDLLDRVAVCANEYFALGAKPKDVHFRTFWRENDGTGAWRGELKVELDHWNQGVIALGELAYDLGEGGLLSSLRDLRNVGTHRFSVLHDMGSSPSRESPAVDHHDLEQFQQQTIDALQVARSAILYLRDAIMWCEARRDTGALRLTRDVAPHHYIRGEK